jgi:hypothetical protein
MLPMPPAAAPAAALVRRGGGPNRWHSLVTCNYGDSTTSRFVAQVAPPYVDGLGRWLAERLSRGGPSGLGQINETMLTAD